MNEDRSSRYHRLRRRAQLIWLLLCLAGGVALLVGGGFRSLRDAVVAITGAGPSSSSTVAIYALVLILGYHALLLPVAAYQGFVLERRYGLGAARFSTWLIDFVKAAAVITVVAVLASVLVYLTMAWWPRGWWAASAFAFAAALLGLARLLPVALLPLFYSIRPLERDTLRTRLAALCERARVPVLDMYVWGLGEKSRRVNAALVGTGPTRRILLSDTLLADYSDEEIEVVLAHELGHHVHADMRTTLLAEFVSITISFAAGAVVLHGLWRHFRLTSPADVAGLPLLIGAGVLVSGATGLLLKAWSRRNERRADEFALAMTGRPEAFMSAMRRLSTQNLAEQRPSRAALWFFHTHPPVEQRIECARRYGPIP